MPISLMPDFVAQIGPRGLFSWEPERATAAESRRVKLFDLKFRLSDLSSGLVQFQI
jgi:hypothetical protein